MQNWSGWGGVGAAAGTIGGIIDAANQPGQYGHVNVGASIGSSALAGAALGTSIVPGWGTLVGGVVGAGYGAVKSITGNNKADSRESKARILQAEAKRAANAQRYLEDPAGGTAGREWFKHGGPLNIPYKKTMGVYAKGGALSFPKPVPGTYGRKPGIREIITSGEYTDPGEKQVLINYWKQTEDGQKVARNAVSLFGDGNSQLGSWNDKEKIFLRTDSDTAGRAKANAADEDVRNKRIIEMLKAKGVDTTDLLILKDGGNIHIKPENRGKFNATKARTGKTTEELTHSSNPVTRKRAVFAQNAAGWKHAAGGQIEQLSSGSVDFHGASHANGGIKLPGVGAEVEDGETMNDGYVFSKELGIAQIHRPIAKAIGKIEKKPMTPERATALQHLKKRENRLKAVNEYLRTA